MRTIVCVLILAMSSFLPEPVLADEIPEQFPVSDSPSEFRSRSVPDTVSVSKIGMSGQAESHLNTVPDMARLRPLAVRTKPPVEGRYHGKNIVKKVIDWAKHTNDTVAHEKFSFDIIGAPYYSSDVQFAATVLGTAQYHTAPDNPLIPPSNASLRASISTTLFYMFGVDGVHIFRSGRRRINYYVKYQSLPTYFWGIGFNNGINDIRSPFRELSTNARVEYLEKVFGKLYIGPALEYDYYNAQKRRGHTEVWRGLPDHTVSVGAGIVAEYDSRDVKTAAERGCFLRFVQRFFPRFGGNEDNSFMNTQVTANIYRKIWKGGVLAGQIHGNLTFGNTPWGMMPTFGEGSMRGYYLGRFRDKCEADITLELRQHVWKRSGMVVWVGAGSVAPKVSAFRLNKILPNGGIGYRFEFKKRVNIRVDLGFGRRTWAFEFNINECF